MSSGCSVRGSMTSASIPSAASASAAASALPTVQPVATMVTSSPVRRIAASPNGTRYSPSGTSPCSSTSR